MADFSELLAGEARRLQPNYPPPFDELVRTRRLRDRRNRLAAGTLMLLTVAGITATATLFGPTRSATNTATPPPSHNATTSSTPTASVTARLTLAATTVRAGETLTGQITVENNTGDPIRVAGCASIYQVSLIGGDHQEAPPGPMCLRYFTIPVGQSTYPVNLTAAYDSCSMIAKPSKRCLDNGHMPPLPYGDYAATTFAPDDQAPLPEPVAVTVLP